MRRAASCLEQFVPMFSADSEDEHAKRLFSLVLSAPIHFALELLATFRPFFAPWSSIDAVSWSSLRIHPDRFLVTA